jgi:hypothetical protein
VAHVWLINPASKTLEVMALAAGRWTLLATHVGAAVVSAEPFGAIDPDLEVLWTTA